MQGPGAVAMHHHSLHLPRLWVTSMHRNTVQPPCGIWGRNTRPSISLMERRWVRAAAVASDRNLYAVLGVPPHADLDELKAAYRGLVRQWHPDLHFTSGPDMQAEAAARLQGLNQAYELLCDPAQRQVYDQNLHIVQAAEAAYAAAEAQPGSLTPEQLTEFKLAMERAQSALTQAVRARTRARDAQRARKAKLRAKSPVTPTSAHQPAVPPTGAARDGGGGGAPASDSNGSSKVPGSAESLPPQAARALQREARAAKQKQRQERRHARREATQVRGWAQWAEAEAAGLQRAATQQLQGQDTASESDGEDEGEWATGLPLWAEDGLGMGPLHEQQPAPFRSQPRNTKQRFIWPGEE